MDPAPAGGGVGNPGGGPAPFLLKTYDMVDDPATDAIVSWSPTTPTSFIVWNPPEFAARLLPTYFKHNNFSSFIRQLNTYGFRKIDPERWEFANEDFLKGHKHLLKNIHRRKPIHSHSLPPSSSPALSDADRAALEDEIDRLTREKAALQSDLWRFKQHQSGTRIQIDDLERRLADMEQRQLKIVAFLQHPKFVDSLIRLAGAGAAAGVGGEGESEESTRKEVVHRKRRLPAELDYVPDGAAVFNRDFCDKLRLELCPAMSRNSLVSPSAQSSNEGSGGLGQPECLAILPETLELSDTGASRKGLACPQAPEEGDGLLPCHLNLTLASCPMQVDTSHLLDQGDEVSTGGGEDVLSRGNAEGDSGAVNVQSGVDEQAPAAPQGRVNDVFWEQFLTERPGSSDAEEASSSLRVQPVEEQAEDKNLGDGTAWRNRKDLEQLTL